MLDVQKNILITIIFILLILGSWKVADIIVWIFQHVTISIS